MFKNIFCIIKSSECSEILTFNHDLNLLCHIEMINFSVLTARFTKSASQFLHKSIDFKFVCPLVSILCLRHLIIMKHKTVSYSQYMQY